MIYPFQGKYPSIHPSVFLTDDAVIVGDVTLDEDVSVWFGTVIRGDVNSIHVGARTNIQDNSTLHVTWEQYSLVIGEEVTVGHGAILHGCTIRDRVLIGMGATVLDGAEIGNESLIAAGTLVRQHFKVPDGALVAGVPGKVVRMLSAEERSSIRTSAEHYLHYVGEFRRNGDLERGLDFTTYLQTIRGGL